MKVGFTGTRNGMTAAQYSEFCVVIKNIIEEMTEFHHGDCVGSDYESHNAVHKISNLSDSSVIMHIHPPSNSSLRAWCDKGIIKQHTPKLYLVRNHDIVEAVDFMIATPAQMTEKLRSGTWSTIRYARLLRVDLCIIYPDGSIKGRVGLNE